MKPMRSLQFVVVLMWCAVIVQSCAFGKPQVAPTLSPEASVIYRADEALVAIEAVQDAAIGLNAIRVCLPPPDQMQCQPFLSDNDTRMVKDLVKDAVITTKLAPDGYLKFIGGALDRIIMRLDESTKKKLMPYIAAAQTILRGV